MGRKGLGFFFVVAVFVLMSGSALADSAPRVVSRAIYAVREAMQAYTVRTEPYHWYRALFYLDMAQEELAQHDIEAAKRFAEISEQHALKALHRKK